MLLITLNVILLLFLIWAIYRIIRIRKKLITLKHLHGHSPIHTKHSPIQTVNLNKLSNIFSENQFGMISHRNVVMPCNAIFSSTSAFESLILSVLATQANNMFEFGTCSGSTTYNWALNSSKDARIITLTLSPSIIDQVQFSKDDLTNEAKGSLNDSCFEKFIYQGTDVEYKITQLFSDSKKFDAAQHHRQFDLIFVDGAHTYSYCMNDSEKALAMLKPKGIILWHDYHGPYIGGGVWKALTELAKTIPLYHIKNTSLVFYRDPS